MLKQYALDELQRIKDLEDAGGVLWEGETAERKMAERILELLRQPVEQVPKIPQGEFSHLFFDEEGNRRMGRRKGAET